MSIDSAGLHISADLVLHWYGILIVLGIAIGAEAATWLAERNGYKAEHVWRGLLWVILFALVGARLWFILFPPTSVVANGFTVDWFLSHFFDVNEGAVAIWTGGLGIIGGMIGGIIGLAMYTRREKLPFVQWLDIAAFGLVLGQTIGRFGNGANQDLYGPPTHLVWGVLIDNSAQRLPPYNNLTLYPLDSTYFHPVFLYEVLLTALIFALMVFLLLRYRQQLKTGDLTLIYIAAYGIGRAALESLRINVSLVGGVNVSQVVAGVAGIVALVVLVRRFRTR